MAATAAAALAAAASLSAFQHDKTDCCGIIGVVGTKEHADAREFLLDGLTILKNRGYDSAGIATVPYGGGEMHITKFASDGDKADSIELVGRHSHSLGHTAGIAHTRWYVFWIDITSLFVDWFLIAVSSSPFFSLQGYSWR
jgi:glucosamine--fructose-6-phosphate aminotransferase (isomerizing)